MRRKLVVGLGLISAISVVIVVLMATLGTVTPNTLRFEVAKIVLQAGLVSAFGAALSLLTYEYHQETQRAEKLREEKKLRRESRQELLRGVLAHAATAYTDIKRRRRPRNRLIVSRELAIPPETPSERVRVRGGDQYAGPARASAAMIRASRSSLLSPTA